MSEDIVVQAAQVGAALRIPVLRTCTFPIVPKDYPGYGTTMVLPAGVRWLFTNAGAHAVRIVSRSVVERIPNFGGGTSGTEEDGLPIHADHWDSENDPRRFLALIKRTPGPRTGETLIARNALAAELLETEEAFFVERRMTLGAERCYDDRFRVTKEEYDACFDDPYGYELLIADIVARFPNIPETTIRLKVLCYLIRGPSANALMRELREEFGGLLYALTWDEPFEMYIIDNWNVLHGRDGGNSPPLQRNYFE